MAIFLSFSGLWLVLLLTLFVIRFGRHLHKHEYRYYTVFAILTLAATVFSVLQQIEPTAWLTTPLIYQVVWQGHLTLALFILVMFAGAFKKKSKAKIVLTRVRRELAILGFMTLIPHATLLIITALSAFNPTGTLALLVMTPLFITSFPKIRKKMSPLSWRKLHRWAYPAYALIFLHIASITVIAQRGGSGEYNALWWLRLGIYTFIFAFYCYLKYQNYLKPSIQKAA